MMNNQYGDCPFCGMGVEDDENHGEGVCDEDSDEMFADYHDADHEDEDAAS